jgi:hypothetical protein
VGEFSVLRSDDAGASWQPLVPNIAGQPTHRADEDPFFYLDPATDRIFVDDLLTSTKCSQLSYSDDEGASWTPTLAGCSQFDHQTIFAGPPASSTPSGYPNIVYHCAFSGGATTVAGFTTSCEKSLDGGRLWLPTGAPVAGPALGPGNVGEPVCDGELGHGYVGRDGTVFLPNGLCGQPHLAISHDEGLTWNNVQVSDLGFPFDGRVYGHDGSVGVDAEGVVYFGWIAHDRMPYLILSRDQGQTWTPPVPLAAPGVREAALFQLDVGAPGRIAFEYMGSTNSPGAPFNETPCQADPQACLAPCQENPTDANCLIEPPGDLNVTWDGFMGLGIDATSQSPSWWSATVNPHEDPLIRGACRGLTRCQEDVDFLDIKIGPDGTPWASFVDGCGPACMNDASHADDMNEAVVGHLVDGPKLR